MKEIILISAIGKNGEIGKNNKLIWKVQEDLQSFKKKTLGYSVVMGRKTYESLPNGALPKRTNFVLSKNLNFKKDNIKVLNNIEDIFLIKDSKIYIIGGEQIYSSLINNYSEKITSIDITEFDREEESADSYFPIIPKSKFYVKYIKYCFTEKGESYKNLYYFKRSK